MKYRISVGTLGWIDKNGPWPFSSGRRFTAEFGQMVDGGMSWVLKAYLGLAATANSPPTSDPLNFKQYRTSKNFRAMVWANLEFEDGGAGTGPVNAKYVGSESQSRIVDYGYTPPIDTAKIGMMGSTIKMMNEADKGLSELLRNPIGVLAPDDDEPATTPRLRTPWDNMLDDLQDQQCYPGVGSPISEIHRGRQHNNSVFPPLSATERLIASGLVRFRAGPHTDLAGIKDAKSAYHVPWVWAEFLLSSLGGGKVRLRGASSVFPTVQWYLNDRAAAPPHRQASDSKFPPMGVLGLHSMKIWPVLSAGAPASGSQPDPSADRKFIDRKLPITSMPWTVPGGAWIDVQGVATPVVGS